MLVIAAALTCLSGVVASPGTTPDEDEHYAYIKHLADHYGEFPIDYANMFKYSREHPNTATHPPLYYYLLATAYRVLQPNRHFTEIVRDKDYYTGGISRSSVVPILRAASWFLSFIGLLGVYRLTRYYVRAGLLRPWLAAAAVALFSFIPAYTYIAGSLNNDVAVLMLWPFIVLYSTKYYLTGRWSSFWKAVFVLAAGILSKGTFWLFVLGFAALVLARLIRDLRARCRRDRLREAQSESASVKPAPPSLALRLTTFTWAILALAMTAAAVIHVGSNLTRYGQLHPNARTIHLTADGRRIVQDPPRPNVPEHLSYVRIDRRVAPHLIATTTGFLGHTEHFFRSNYPALVPPFRICLTAAFLILAGFFRGRQPQLRIKLLVITGLAVVVVFYLFYVYVQYAGWPKAGHITAQGRYFIGYLHLAVLLLFVMASDQLSRGPLPWKVAKSLVFWPCVAVLFLILFNPLFYLRNTLESYRKANVEEIVRKELQSQGFQQLPISLWTPRGMFEDHGRREDCPSYGMVCEAAAIGGEISPPARACGDLEVLLWARGDDILGERAVVGIGVRPPFADKPSASPDPADVRRLIEAGEEIEVYTVRLPREELDGRKQLLFARLMNQPVFQSRLMNKIWPRTRSVSILGLYYRFVGCGYQETARRPISLAWRPLNDVELLRDPPAVRLRPTGADPQIETDLAAPEGPGQTALVLSIESPEATTVQWFLNTGAGYGEQESIIKEIAAGPSDLTIRLPAGLRSLRLDPVQPLTVSGAELVTSQWLPVN